MHVITTDHVPVPMTVHGMGNAVPAWHITGITMRGVRDVSFPKKRKQPTTGALRIWQGIMDYSESNLNGKQFRMYAFRI